MVTVAQLDLRIRSLEAANATKRLKNLEGAAKKTTAATSKQTAAFSKQSKTVGVLGSAFEKTASSVRALAGAFVAISTAQAALRTVADFREALALLKGVTETSGEAFEKLEKQARQLGATTKFTATQAAQAQLALARAGLTVNEVIATNANVLDLAVAGNLELARAAEITAITMRQFGIEAEASARVVDVLTKAANKSNTDIEQLAQAFKFVGPIAAGFGKTIEETAAALGVLADGGLQATQGGTALRGVFAALAQPSKQAAVTIERLAKASGQSAEAFDITKRSVEEVFQAFQDAQAGPNELLRIFGRLQAPGALVLTKLVGRIGNLKKELDEASGAARTLAEIAADQLKGDIQSLNSAVQELFITADDGLGPALRSTIKLLTAVAREMAGVEQETGEASVAVKILAFLVKALIISFAAFIALKLGAVMIGVAQGVLLLAASFTTLRAALIRTGIGAGAVAIGFLAAAVLEATDAFDDETDKLTKKADEAQKAAVKRSKELEAVRNKELAAAQLELAEQFKVLDALANEQEKRANARKAAAKREVQERKRAADDIIRIQKDLSDELEVAGLEGQERRIQVVLRDLDRAFRRVRGLDPDVLLPPELEIKLNSLRRNVTQFFEDIAKAERALEIGKVADEAFDTLDAGLADAQRNIKQLIEGTPQIILDTRAEFQSAVDAINKVLKLQLEVGIITPRDLVNKLNEVQDTIEEIARQRSLDPFIEQGRAALQVLDDLSMGTDRSANSLAQFEEVAGQAFETYQKLIDADIGSQALFLTNQEKITASVEQFRREVAQMAVIESLVDVAGNVSRAFLTAFQEIITGSENAAEAALKFAQRVADILIQKLVFEPVIDAITTSLRAALKGASLFGGAAVASGSGNVFRSGEVQAFQRGGIIGGPTTFPLNRGLGLAGEAGPEAILPLKRGRDGQLGVTLDRPARRQPFESRPFVLQNVSAGASMNPTRQEISAGPVGRTVNVQFNVSTPDASSFRRSSSQITGDAFRTARSGAGRALI